MEIAIDPGTNKTGLAVFNEGRIVNTYLITSEGSPAHRCRELMTQRIMNQTGVWEQVLGVVKAIAIEDFEVHGGTKSIQFGGLREIRGWIACRLAHEYPKAKFYYKKKGKTPKQDAVLLCRSLGLECDGDEADAVYVGYLAGFLK